MDEVRKAARARLLEQGQISLDLDDSDAASSSSDSTTASTSGQDAAADALLLGQFLSSFQVSTWHGILLHVAYTTHVQP